MKLIILFTIISILCNGEYAAAQIISPSRTNPKSISLKLPEKRQTSISLDDLLHQHFDFTSNRPISTIIDGGNIDLNGESINRIDRVVQSNHFIFFLYKSVYLDENGNKNEISPAKEWDDILQYVASFYERYLDIEYSIPVFIQFDNDLNDSYVSANIVPEEVGDIVSGLLRGDEYSTYGFILRQELDVKDLAIPKEDALIPDGNVTPYLFDVMRAILGFDWSIWEKKNICKFLTDNIGIITTPETKRANGGYPIQFHYSPKYHLVINFYPHWLIDIYEDISGSFANENFTSLLCSPDENINPNLHLGKATLATINSLGWKLKPSVDYNSTKFTGKLWEDENFDDASPCWVSLEDTLYYDLSPSSSAQISTINEKYLATPYYFNDWKEGKVSIDNLNEYWMNKARTTDIMEYMDAHYLDIDWDENYRISVLISRYNEDKVYWNYKIMIDEVLFKCLQLPRSYKQYDFYPQNPNIMSNLRDTFYSIYPESTLDEQLTKVKETQLSKWDKFIEDTDWMEWIKQYEAKGLGNVDDYLKNWFLEKPEFYYESVLTDLSQKICSWWCFQGTGDVNSDPMIQRTLKILINKYPLEKLLEAYGMTGIESITSPTEVNIGCTSDGVINVSSNITYSIYDLIGRIIVLDHQGQFQLPSHGMYIVRTADKSFKIAY